MTGADIIEKLLADHEPLTELVAAESVKMGRLPDDTPLPALLLRVISSKERQPLRRGGRVRTIDRVSVTGRFENYRQQRAVMTVVMKACAGKTGQIGDAQRVAVLTAGGGPDLNGPGNSFEKTQDFAVSFDAEA